MWTKIWFLELSHASMRNLGGCHNPLSIIALGGRDGILEQEVQLN